MIRKLKLTIRQLILSLSRLRYARDKRLNIGQNTLVYPNCTISIICGGGVSIGSQCRLGVTDRGYWAGFVSPTKLTVWGEGAKILIGDRTVLNGVCISSRHLVEIGHECLFATGIQIMDSDTHRIASRNRIWDLDTPQPVKIGHNVWVGLNAIILKGTIIGDNCVVGAGSVVKGVFPDNCVIAGNPARIVKRFVIND